jgi:hypothetical protein
MCRRLQNFNQLTDIETEAAFIEGSSEYDKREWRLIYSEHDRFYA